MPDFQEAQIAIATARSGINAAKAYRDLCPIPDELQAAEARLTELGRLANLPAPLFPVPTGKADAIEKALRAHARAVVEHDTVRQIALEMGVAVGGQIFNGFRSVAPDWINALADKFDGTYAEFSDANGRAPEVIVGGSQADDIAAWVAVTGAAERLDHLLATRTNIGQSAGEEGADFHNIWLSVVPPLLSAEHEIFNGNGGVGGEWSAFSNVVQKWNADKMNIGSPLERWRTIAGLRFEVSLARAGEIQTRASLVSDYAEAAWALNASGGRGSFPAAMQHADVTYRAVSRVHA